MKSKSFLRAISLLVLFVSFLPWNNAGALASAAPPVDMFQLPWEQGKAWMAIDGIDNGSKRPASSSHNHKLGGAIDFAPRKNMITGEDTSNFWVTAAAAGTVIETASCYITIAHDNGWITQYQFLGNIQVKLGEVVARNQRLAVIADGVRQKYCAGYQEINIPHLHFILRPTIIGASFAGWEVNYNSFLNSTTFTKDGSTLGLFKLLLNVPSLPPTPSPVPSATVPVPTATSTAPSGPYVSTVTDTFNIDIGQSALVTVRLNNVPTEGYTSAEFTCPYNASLVEVSNIIVVDLFGPDPALAINGPQNGSFIMAIAGSSGNKATTSGPVFNFSVKGLQAGQTAIECTARVSKGDNVLVDIPSVGTSLTILGDTPSATPVVSPTAIEPPAPTFTSIPEVSPTPTILATPTSPVSDWLIFTNSKYGFQFRYPTEGQIVGGNTDNYARIDLPFMAGTNLSEKYLEVIVAENANPCRSPLATSSMLETSETVIINGISFLKETGGDGGAGHLRQWVAYSTSRDNACVSLDFVLHSLNAGNFPTPPPVFDYAAESAVFGQIVSTYAWLGLSTATPTATSVPGSSPTPTGSPSPTSVPGTSGTLTGQVLASKPVTVGLYDATNTLITSVIANSDGTFSLSAPAETYTVRATASGFLSAQGSTTLTAGNTNTMPTISLPAGDIDNNDVIDPLDALTIGMSYNTAVPAAADLNNDGVINVLDLELLAGNYRKTGPVAWE